MQVDQDTPAFTPRSHGVLFTSLLIHTSAHGEIPGGKERHRRWEAVDRTLLHERAPQPSPFSKASPLEKLLFVLTMVQEQTCLPECLPQKPSHPGLIPRAQTMR